MMSRLSFLAVVLTVILAMMPARPAVAEDVPRMTIEELQSVLTNPEVIVLDVRTPHDWDDSAAMIKGAIREDPTQIGSWIGKYPKNKTLVLYCA